MKKAEKLRIEKKRHFFCFPHKAWRLFTKTHPIHLMLFSSPSPQADIPKPLGDKTILYLGSALGDKGHFVLRNSSYEQHMSNDETWLRWTRATHSVNPCYLSLILPRGTGRFFWGVKNWDNFFFEKKHLKVTKHFQEINYFYHLVLNVEKPYHFQSVD